MSQLEHSTRHCPAPAAARPLLRTLSTSIVIWNFMRMRSFRWIFVDYYLNSPENQDGNVVAKGRP